MDKIMYVSDIHVPYHDQIAVEQMLIELKEEKPDYLILGGDIVDFFKVSKYDKSPYEGATLQSEIDQTVNFLTTLKKYSGNAEVYWIEGNHEERLSKYLKVNAPELIGLRSLNFAEMFRLDDLDITYVEDNEVLEIYDWVIRHGHECGVSTTPGLSARKGVMMYGSNYIQGHIHRANVVHVSNYSGDFVGVENPCLCDMNPGYVKGYAGWQQGWTIMEREDYEFPWQIRQRIL